MKAHLLVIMILAASSVSWSASTVPECAARPEFVTRTGPVLNLKSLPPMILVGKKVDYYVENRTSGLKIWGVQSFKKGDSKILCASSGNFVSESFSMYAPTLIDLTDEKVVGDSYWQFHMIANLKQFGIWNKKSRIFSATKDLDAAFSKIGAQVQIVQHTHNEYELLFTRESEQSIEVLSIQFDAVSSLK